jgi:hypothetical protein
MSQFFSVSNEHSDGVKLVRFFRLVGALGGIVVLVRVLIGIAIFGGLIVLLP